MNGEEWYKVIKVVAKGYVRLSEVEKFKEIAAELVQESRKEKENISYGLYQETTNPQILTFIEEWEDQATLDKHMKTPHFTKILPELAKLQEQETDINIYTLTV